MEKPTSRLNILTEKEVGPALASKWLIDVLTRTYGHHNLMASIVQTEQDIRSGRLCPFFKLEEGKLACACALIKSEKTIEIGRAANLPGKKGGGHLMQDAISTWDENIEETRPLVAEIRMAGPFEEIAGGQGSQATLLSKVGMIPHAFLPAFHHPGPHGPDRQELFCFTSSEKLARPVTQIAPKSIFLPDLPGINLELLKNFLEINKYDTVINLVNPDRATLTIGLKRIASKPFNLFVVDPEGRAISPDSFIEGKSSPFDLVVVNSFSNDLPKIATDLIASGFIISGISSPHEGSLQLLFGRLRECILAPTLPISTFPFIETKLIMDLHRQFETKKL